MSVRIGEREMMMDCIEGAPGSEVIIGLVVLTGLDLEVDEGRFATETRCMDVGSACRVMPTVPASVVTGFWRRRRAAAEPRNATSRSTLRPATARLRLDEPRLRQRASPEVIPRRDNRSAANPWAKPPPLSSSSGSPSRAAILHQMATHDDIGQTIFAFGDQFGQSEESLAGLLLAFSRLLERPVRQENVKLLTQEAKQQLDWHGFGFDRLFNVASALFGFLRGFVGRSYCAICSCVIAIRCNVRRSVICVFNSLMIDLSMSTPAGS